MDNKEAINWLTRIRDRLMTTCSKQFEAMTIAIAALEFKERYDNFWEEVKSEGMKGKETEIHHGGRVFRIREVVQ